MSGSTGFGFKIPGAGVAKERPRFNAKSKSVRTPERTKEFEREVEWRCREAMKLAGLSRVDRPVSVEIIIYRKRKGDEAFARPMDKGDVDNLAKGILDAMNKIAYIDDKQVTTLLSAKRFTAGEPYITVSIQEDIHYE